MLKSAKRQMSWLTMSQWQSFVETQTASSVFHHRCWVELISEFYGFEVQIPAIVDNGEIVAAFPFLQTRSLRGTRKLLSLPFTDYLQVLSTEKQAVEELCQQIHDHYADQFDTVMLRNDQALTSANSECPIVRHELRTDLPLEQIESLFAGAIKRNLNKCRRNRLEFQSRVDKEAMDIFYRMHVLTRRKLGVPVQSRSFFRALHERMIKSGFGMVCVVSKNSSPIAAGVMLNFNGRFIYKYAASDPSALADRPNDWLVYNAIRLAQEAKCQWFDFGISDKQQEGLRRFKRKWGATESDVFYNHVVGEPDEPGPPSRAMRLAADIIRRSPTLVCRVLGKALYKYSQ